jgi:NAD(P)-dependent dehydrogenase (short-subunit alcohol dehydrogenase family)
MPNPVSMNNSSEYKAYVITGPTSGIGRATTLEVIKHSKVVLVGRDREKLNQLQKEGEQKGGHAVSVVCDLSDLASVRRAAAEIIALDLPIVGLLNNAGIFPMRATKNALGWDNAFATNHIGPFVLTEALIPLLPDGANVVFVASGVEDPERKPAKMSGFRGGRYEVVTKLTRGDARGGTECSRYCCRSGNLALRCRIQWRQDRYRNRSQVRSENLPDRTESHPLDCSLCA